MAIGAVLTFPFLVALYVVGSVFLTNTIDGARQRTENAQQGYYSVYNFDDVRRVASDIIAKNLPSDDCGKIRYVKLKIRLPDDLSHENFQMNCFNILAIERNDPMTCTKAKYPMECLKKLVNESGLAYKQWLPETNYFCFYSRTTELLQCGTRTDENLSADPERHSLDACSAFTHLQGREWCQQKRAIRENDMSACDQLTIEPLRENCYLALDTTCQKQSSVILRQVCDAMNVMQLPRMSRSTLPDLGE